MNAKARSSISGISPWAFFVALFLCLPVFAQEEPTITTKPSPEATPPPSDFGGLRMTVDDLELTIAVLDENYQRQGGMIRFNFAENDITIATDEAADRMRIIIPVLSSDQLDGELLHRLMQANFDSTLDARYAIAQGVLWSTFIHPLSSLTEEDFLSGIGQTINTANSFGTSFSSGELVFGGGDSSELQQRQLIDDLLEKGQQRL